MPGVSSDQDENNLKIELIESTPVLITDVCLEESAYNGNETELKKNQQIQLAVTLIKSAAVLSTSSIKFIIQVEHDIVYDTIKNQISLWPKNISQKIDLQKRTVYFPEGSVFRTIFKPCSFARIFYPDHLKDLDSVIHLDTDMVFMRPPEELWRIFNYFDSDQMSGLAHLEFYNTNLTFPYVGKNGLNSGLWMMNLTRMRQFPGGWENESLRTFETYKRYIKLPDQDIANILFSKYPHYLYVVGCHWNFRSISCYSGVNLCEEANHKGVHLLHGTCHSFYDYTDVKLRVIYEAWRDFQPGRPLTDLLFEMQMVMGVVDQLYIKISCSNISGIESVLTKAFEDRIKTLG